MNPDRIGERPRGSAGYAHLRGLRGLARVFVIVHLRAPRWLAMARFVEYHGPHEQDDRNDLSERVYPTSR